MQKYLVFVVYVYELKNERGEFQNSVELQLIEENRQLAEARALEIAGTEERINVFTKQVIEKYVE